MRQRSNQPATMRIAIAGGGGFAYILAEQLTQSANAVLVLSRQSHPELEALGCQVATVDYGDAEELRYVLLGVDVLISTVAGNEQLSLIDAARLARVRVFVPSEFEGDMQHRPSNDPLDRHSQAALNLLQQWFQSRSHHMRYTVFSCGIFMERFACGGLRRYNMGESCGLGEQGDYLVNFGEATAEAILTTANGQSHARVSLTSAYDVARFVAAALEMGIQEWPREFRMRAETMTVTELISACQAVRGTNFAVTAISYHHAEAHAQNSLQAEDYASYLHCQRLLQTANGRYHVRQVNLDEAMTQVQPIRFRQWLQDHWQQAM